MFSALLLGCATSRALALPPNLWLAFRYELGWIADDLQTRLGSDETRRAMEGEEVLIAYIDQHEDRPDVEVVPCRFATLVNVAPVGQTASLQLQVDDFAYAADLASFNERLRASADALLPQRVGGELKPGR